MYIHSLFAEMICMITLLFAYEAALDHAAWGQEAGAVGRGTNYGDCY